jgi:pimeloyl-ACP methyl ester carboxylesterase
MQRFFLTAVLITLVGAPVAPATDPPVPGTRPKVEPVPVPSAPPSGAQNARLEEELETLRARHTTKKAHVRAAEVGVRAAELRAERIEKLVRTGGATREQAEDAKREVLAARARFDIRLAETGEVEVRINSATKRLEEAKGGHKTTGPSNAEPIPAPGPAAPGADEATELLDRAPSRYAHLDKMSVHYKALGEGKTAVVFIHGAFVDLTTWRFQVRALADKGRIILIDLPGHGRSDKPKVEYTMDLFARAVDAVLKDAGVEKAVLVGHSMGTPVARQFWRLHPEKTAALVAVDGMIVPLPFAAPGAVKALDWKEVRETMLRSVDRTFGKTAPEEVRKSLKELLARTPDHVFEGTLKGLADPTMWKEDAIKVPVQMILAANRFSIWPADYEQQVRKIAPKLEFHQITDVGHCLMLEKPNEFNAVLGEFLKKQNVLKP